MGGRDLKDPFLSVYGHVTVDQIISIDEFLPPGITADALSKKTTLGGTGPNIAVAAAKLGCPTAQCLDDYDMPDVKEELSSLGLLP